jgi:phospholipase C
LTAYHGRRVRWITLAAAALTVTAAAAALARPAGAVARLTAVRAAAAAAATTVPPAGTAAGAGRGRARQSPVRHVVVLYLENHSFDSLLGYWCDDHPRRCPKGGMPSSVTLSNGAVVHPGVAPDVVPNVSHGVRAQRSAIDGGKMDGWQKVPGCHPAQHYRCISGYKPSQVPNLVSLANRFAISDATFSMADSPSWGGHLYAAMSNLDGFAGGNPKKAAGVPAGPGWGCNSSKVTPWSPSLGSKTQMVPSCIPDPALSLPFGGAFRKTPVHYAPSIMDRLGAAGLSWRIYGEPAPERGGGYIWDICPSIAECLDTSQHSDNLPAAQFAGDARAGNLAAFSIVTPGGKDALNSEHNGFSMTAGDNWLGRVASAVMNGPDWNSTVLFITWDDCGCFYDQVAPGVNPDGTGQGPRVPLVVVSPFARHAFTDSKPATFASILAYTEQTFGLSPLSANDAKAYPFTSIFNYSQRPLRPVAMVTRPVPKTDHIKYWEARQDT